MTEKTVITLLATFSKAYPSQFAKMTPDDKRVMSNTWMAAFGHHPDMVISEAAALAIKKSQFLPSLPEFAEYIRRAELILEARRVDDQHLRDGKTWAGAGMKSGEIAQMPRIGSAASDPMKIKEAKETENFLLWLGDKPENAKATAWCDVEEGDQQ